MPTLSQQVHVDQSELVPRCNSDPVIKKFRQKIDQWRESEKKRSLGMELQISDKWKEFHRLKAELVKAEEAVVRIAEQRRKMRREIDRLNRQKAYRRGPCQTYENSIARRMKVIRNKIIEEKILASKLEFQKVWKVKPSDLKQDLPAPATIIQEAPPQP